MSTLRQVQGRTSVAMLLGIASLVGLVALSDWLTPLGLAVWIFYMLPVSLCLYTGNPLLPLYVAAAGSGCTVLLAFERGELVDRWLGLVNRGMYLITLWPLAFTVRQRIIARLTTEQDVWLKTNQAQLLGELQGELALAELGARALKGTLQAMDAQVGALYVKDHGGFERIASHGLRSDAGGKRYEASEGIIGETGKRQQVVVIRDVPADFLHIDIGLGAGAPRQIVLAPLRTENQTSAVIAIGTMHEVDELARELLGRLSEPLAVTINSAQYKARLRELLQETQAQAEELQAQQSELEAQQAELEASNEELNQTNAQMEVQTQELEQQRDALRVARDAANQASGYKSEFLANMSHELRTPLNSSLILARLLADNKEGNLNEDQVRSAQTIYDAGNDLLLLINDILDLAKIEAGRAEVTVEAISIEQLTETLDRAFRPVATERCLEFIITRSPTSPARVQTDGRRLEQILKNLLSNAFKFTPSGEVEFSVTPEDGGRVRFAVRDTGVGIPEQQQGLIFEAFRQADGSTSRQFGGTGLGLSISRELSRLLGGDIELVSSPGHGSTFSLVLPVDGSKLKRKAARARESAARERRITPEASAVELAPPPFPDDREQRKRPGRLILAVEDDKAFARILYDLAHELDFDCVVASTAAAGLTLARTLQPSGILLDIGLPDASGLAVLDSLKHDAATRHVPVHMVSVADNVQAALELGAVGYALKPVAREELVQAIQKLAQQSSQKLRRVLIVEDDLRQQESISALLRADGVELLTAGSMAEALGTLEQKSFDCMVLDLTLPDGSGFDLLEKMAEGGRYSFPPVIVYTGRELDSEDENRLRRYSQSIIVKGARSPERLLDEVTLFLHQIESNLPPDRRRMLAEVRQRETAFDGRRVLVVEDDVRNVFALSRVLEPRGAKVEIARNGREALAALEREPNIELVLMDLMMPEMDGLTAIREIRKQETLKRLPIIALTAKAMPQDREQALHAGANDYMPKPFEVDRLISLCRVWLRR